MLAITPKTAQATEKMIVIGGGLRPEAANSKFVSWGGGDKAKVLVLTWSTGGLPEDAFDYFSSDIIDYNPASITHGVQSGDVSADRDKLMRQINDATAIFFTGGDQNKTMNIIDADLRTNPGDSILALLQSRYKAGVVMGGTSAGCALMSTPMLTGKADVTILDGKQVETRDGLGMLPGVILDQHFLVRGRLLRLMGLIQENPSKLGLGIDEDTALLIEENRYAEVVGATKVLAMAASGPQGQVVVDPLPVGTRYDIVKRARY